MANDYSKYGLTYAEEEYMPSRPAGFIDSSGKFYTTAEADSFIASQTQKADYTAAGGDANLFVDYNALSADPAAVTAALTRAQWDDYVARFVPVEKELMGMSIYGTTDKGKAMIDKEVNAAVGTDGYVTKSLESSAAQAQRGMQRYGAAATEEQKTALENTNESNASLATVDASNRIRQKVLDRSNAIATGATPSAGRAYGLRSE